MKKLLSHLIRVLVLIPLFMSLQSFGQDFDHFQPLKSAGPVPEKFLTSSTEKYEAELRKMSGKEKARLRKLKKQFYLENSFDLNKLLLSGRLLYNDPVSIYVNKVMDEILKNDKDLRGKIELYVLKSTSFNAFTRQNGVIYICVGLLAQLHNEAELAYILCHELTHFTNQHLLQEVVVVDSIKSGRGSYHRRNEDEKMLAASTFSKKEESEADMVGLERFLKTGYDGSKITGEFDIMEYPQYNYSDLIYDKSFLETENLKFPPSYFLKTPNKIEADDDDSLSSHPAAKLRREAVQNRLKGVDFSSKKSFLVGEQEFVTCQKLCRYEMITIFLHYRQYVAAYYNSYVLLHDNPNSFYLKKCVGKALYGISKYASAFRLYEVTPGYEDIQGNRQQVYYFFNSMTTAELNALAVEYLYHLKKEYPQDKEIAALCKDIFSELPQYHTNKLFFSKETKPASLDSLFATLKANDSSNVDSTDEKVDADVKSVNNTIHRLIVRSKYDRQNDEDDEDEDTVVVKKTENMDKNYFIRYAFVDLLKDTGFVAEYDRAQFAYTKQQKENEYEETSEYKKAQVKLLRIEKRKGMALGIDKVVIVNPYYYKIDEAKTKNPVKQVASEMAQKDLNNKIKENATLAGLNYELIDMNDLKASSTDLFNDLATLNYFSEEGYDNQDMHFVNYMTDDIQGIVKKYGTPYFDWSGVVCYRQHNDFLTNYQNCACIALSLFYFPITPYFLYKAIRTRYHTYIVSNVLDLSNGTTKHYFVSKIKFKDRPDVINSVLYDRYLQYKKTAPK